MIHIGIDPGVNKTAICIIRKDQLLGASYLKSKTEVFYNTLDVILGLENKYNESIKVVLERPDRVDAKSTLEDILRLAFVVGQILAVFDGYKPLLVKPVQWKGQTPKRVTKERAKEKIKGTAKYIDNHFANSILHNLYDALGLALYSQQRYHEE